MGAIPSGKGGERFPPLFPLQNAGFGGGSGGAAGGVALDALCSGRSEGRKERVGEKRPARAQDIGLVAPHALARPNMLLPANKNQYRLKLKYY